MSQEIQEGLENTDSGESIEPTESTESNSVETPVESTSTLRPEWTEFLDTIPSEFVSKATPVLEKWDKNFQEVQLANSKYKPFEEFISNDPETLRNAMQIMQMIENDPRGIFDRIGTHHGFLNDEAGQGDEEDDEFEDDSFEEDDPIASNPAFQQMQQQNEAFQAYVEEQENKKMEAQADQFIQSQFSEVTKLHGSELSADDKQVLSNIALGNMQNSGKLDIVGAYSQYSRIVSNARNTTANNSIPSVLSGTGAVPKTPTNYGSKDFENSLEEKLKGLGFGS